jgi:hypothetical protein
MMIVVASPPQSSFQVDTEFCEMQWLNAVAGVDVLAVVTTVVLMEEVAAVLVERQVLAVVALVITEELSPSPMGLR